MSDVKVYSYNEENNENKCKYIPTKEQFELSAKLAVQRVAISLLARNRIAYKNENEDNKCYE